MSLQSSLLPSQEASSSDYVIALEKGLAVMAAFGLLRSSATLSQLSEVTGYTKASVRRSLLTLIDLGYVSQQERLFSLAPRTLRLAHAYVSSDQLTQVAQPILDATSERTRESASLAVLDAQDCVFVARATHRRSLSSGLGVGTRLPAYCSATGRVLLAGLPREDVKFLLGRMARPSYTQHTRTSLRAVFAEIDRARNQGFALIDEELELGLRSIAVPIRNQRGGLIAALSLSVAVHRMTCDEVIEKLLPEMQLAQRQIAALL